MVGVITVALSIFLVTVYLIGKARGWLESSEISGYTQPADGVCTNPPFRYEWRSLHRTEQQSYISAALCLQETPSNLKGQGTLYDDFVYVHHKIGSLSHKSAAFLPWHRAFIHVYEATLKLRCGYTGNLPYWNWELDWTDLGNSSVWDNETGFGGEGDSKFPLGPGDGRCVTTGPFAHSHRLWFEGEEQKHCMGRSFVYAQTNASGSLNGDWYNPVRMGMLRRARNYQVFRRMIEGTVHNGLHWSIRGDFSSLTAANDPIFWLHHAQLDRLWWEWQQRDPKIRNREYWGEVEETDWPSPQSWSLSDNLVFDNLWQAIKVSEVMRTDTENLCYRY